MLPCRRAGGCGSGGGGGVGVEEGAEAELEEGGEAGVAGVDDLADVVDELRDGDPGAAAAADDVADDAVHPRRGGRCHLGRRRRGRVGDVHLRVRVVVVVLLERGELELGGQRGQLRASCRLMRLRTSGGGDVGEVARDVAARRGKVHVGRRALADHGGGGGGFLVLLV